MDNGGHKCQSKFALNFARLATPCHQRAEIVVASGSECSTPCPACPACLSGRTAWKTCARRPPSARGRRERQRARAIRATARLQRRTTDARAKKTPATAHAASHSTIRYRLGALPSPSLNPPRGGGASIRPVARGSPGRGATTTARRQGCSSLSTIKPRACKKSRPDSRLSRVAHHPNACTRRSSWTRRKGGSMRCRASTSVWSASAAPSVSDPPPRPSLLAERSVSMARKSHRARTADQARGCSSRAKSLVSLMTA